MAKYTVVLEFSYAMCVDVYADSEEAAADEVRSRAANLDVNLYSECVESACDVDLVSEEDA